MTATTAAIPGLWPLFSDPGLIAWGVGQVLLGLLAWRSNLLPGGSP